MSGKARFLTALKKLAPPSAGAVEVDSTETGLARRVADLELRLAWQQRALAGLGLVVALKLLGLQVGLDELMQLVGLMK